MAVSAVKHGLFKRGFMLCDRCVLNDSCESFVPGKDCSVEKKSFDLLVSELMSQYHLEGLADQILVERAAMCLIRIARAEVYEANIGVSDKSAVWGKYIASLDNMLRALLKDLALTRSKRKETEKDDLFVDVEKLLETLDKKPKDEKKIFAQVYAPMSVLLEGWEQEGKTLKKTAMSNRNVKKDQDS